MLPGNPSIQRVFDPISKTWMVYINHIQINDSIVCFAKGKTFEEAEIEYNKIWNTVSA